MNHRFNIKKIDKTASTNLLMLELEKDGKLKNGDVLLAENQIAGIGQSGNYWESEAGKNLTFSLFLEELFVEASEVFLINKIVSLAVFDYLVEKGIDHLKIKWPNDMYVGDKKIAGMLTHNSFLGDKLEFSIIGLGLNMNQMLFKSDAPNPVSLKLITRINYNLDTELEKLLDQIQNRFDQLAKEKQHQLNRDYLNCLYGMAEKRTYADRSGRFIGLIKGIDTYGRLLVEKESKQIVTYDFKEIEFLLLST